MGGIEENTHGFSYSGSIKERVLLLFLAKKNKKTSEMSLTCFMQVKNFHPLSKNPLQN